MEKILKMIYAKIIDTPDMLKKEQNALAQSNFESEILKFPDSLELTDSMTNYASIMQEDGFELGFKCAMQLMRELEQIN